MPFFSLFLSEVATGEEGKRAIASRGFDYFLLFCYCSFMGQRGVLLGSPESRVGAEARREEGTVEANKPPSAQNAGEGRVVNSGVAWPSVTSSSSS